MAKYPRPPTKEELLAVSNVIKNATDIVCKCGGTFFVQANRLKKLSKLITGEKQDVVFPGEPALICLGCKEELKMEDDKPADDGIIQLDFRKKE